MDFGSPCWLSWEALLVLFSLAVLVPHGHEAFARDVAVGNNLLQARLEQAVEEHALPGAVFALTSENAEPEIYAAGRADIESNSAIKKDMYFRIGSVTKTFTATSILMLVDRNKIELEDTVASVLSSAEVPNGDSITIRNLLMMRSGLSDYPSNEKFQDLSEQDPEHNWSFRELIDLVHEQYKPNQHFAYRNINYIILGQILEKVSGMSRKAFVSQQICKPLGLEHTFVHEKISMPPNSARGYIFSNNEPKDMTEHFNPSWGGAAGDMVSNARDLTVWLRAFSSGTLLSEKTHEQMMAMRGGPIHGFLGGYGQGVMNLHGAVGHGGDYAGIYTSAVFMYQDMYMVALVNGQLGDHSGDATDVFFDLAHFVSAPDKDPQWLARQLSFLLQMSRDGLEVPGVVAQVSFPDNRTWSKTAGVAKADDTSVPDPANWAGQAMAEGMHFRIASVTKSVTATAILQLRQRGKLCLEDTLEEWLPEIQISTKDKVTLRQLLNHTSGIPRFMNSDFVNKNYADPTQDWSLQERVRFAVDPNGSSKLPEPPQPYEYSNTNYLLLSRIIEKASGLSFAAFLQQNIFTPLDMDNASVPGIYDYSLPEPYAHSYTFNFNPVQPKPETMPAQGWLKDESVSNWQGPGYGNIICTPSDLMTWLQALSKGTLLSEKSRKQMQGYRKTGTKHVVYGLGIEKNHGYVGHDGDLPGYHTAAYSKDGHDFVVLMNGDSLMRRDIFGNPAGGQSGILVVRSIGALLGL
ncbi:MAG: serine hydrolase domain-containing protein [Thermodesulfobacteriota bacterium]